MKFLYNIFMLISEKLVWLLGNFFGKKVKQFRSGQQNVFAKLNACLAVEKQHIWMHVSSLGEYEQGLPVIEKLKEKYPNHQIILTFFSPSGYEVKKDSSPADCVVYLPIDNTKNVRKFLDLLQPEMVFFVKYDFWPNYLFELKKRGIKTYLVSGLFTENHKFFKPQNTWLKKSLQAFRYFFVQDDNSKKALDNQGFKAVTVAGDTRFDRVFRIAKQNEDLAFIQLFKNEELLFIAGSTWQAGEQIITNYINKTTKKAKFIIAPHLVDDKHVQSIKNSIDKKVILFSELSSDTQLADFDVLILNTIGLLNKTYKYADIVYIGGGFGKSIHNIQEPAVFGVPIITGTKISKFKEAVDLHSLGGLNSIENQNDFDVLVNQLLTDDVLRKEKATITKQYALKNVGATEKIIKFLTQNA
jgi:3-deoxy-D-manno-octulosonic-acid transferase